MKTNTNFSFGSVFGGSTLGRYMPAPASRNGNQFLNFMGKAVSAAVGVAGSAMPGFAALDPQYQDMLNIQKQMQDQMMSMTFASNMLKSEHETRMAAVRNIRVG